VKIVSALLLLVVVLAGCASPGHPIKPHSTIQIGPVPIPLS
jgi:PBP1b-binding outer membrane lipoprotein LpoB